MNPSLPGPSGERPPKRFCAADVHRFIDDDEDFGILSDDNDPLYSDSEISSSSRSSSDDEAVVQQPLSTKKGALPSSRGKKIPARQQTSSRSKSSAQRAREIPTQSDNGDLGLEIEDEVDLGTPVDTDWRHVDAGRTTNSFRFVRNASRGMNPDIMNKTNPSEFLFALLNTDIIDQLLRTINDYAQLLCQKNNPALRHSVFSNFERVTRDEFLRFMAILLAMGMDPRHSIKSFWSYKPHRYTPWYGQTMPRNRFEAIYHAFLHAGGAAAEQQEKIEPFLERLLASFQACYYPSQNLSIDEMVIGFRCRWKNKQLNASKPSKYHIKIFGLCDSENGNLFTYYGSDTAYRPNIDPTAAQATKIFEKLLPPSKKVITFLVTGFTPPSRS